MATTEAGSRHPDLPELPEGWIVERTDGLGPFTSRAVLRRADGVEVEWTSRRHRKEQGLRIVQQGAGRHGPVPPIPKRTWWIAVLFAIGSTCFALGVVPAYVDAVSPRLDGLTFFVGSIFFTAASYLSFVEAASRPDAISDGQAVRHGPFHLLAWRPRSIDWWATGVQLIGTFYFNAMTFLALNDAWSRSQEQRLVWRPDVIGSACFLIASYLAWAEVCHSAGRLRLRDVSWWIVVLNLLGSVFFGVSAIGAYVEPSTGDPLDLRWDDGGTFLGAVCFFVAAVLLVPEARRAARESTE